MNCLPRACFALTLLLVALGAALAGAEEAHRLYDGLTLYVDNPQGRGFDLSLDVRDINLYENGPREVLLKVYDPAGNTLVREIIPDDGVTSKAYLPPMGAFDHEGWYYSYLYMQGTQPMWRWSAPSESDRLAATAKRTFKHSVPKGPAGVWRILIVGATDHYVTVKLDPALKYGVAGHPDWLHGHHAMWRKSHLYVPKGAKGAHLMLAEFDMPRSRRVTLRGPDGATLGEVVAPAGANSQLIPFATPLDDQLLTLDVSEGTNDFMVNVKFTFAKDPEVHQRGTRVAPAVFASDVATAKALKGGAIYHDDRLFWQPYQVKLHDWLKKLPEDAFAIKDAEGRPAEPLTPTKPPAKGAAAAVVLPQRDGFFPLNGRHERPPLCDTIMHHWPAHKNRAALNVALRDLIAGLRSVGPNDHVAVATGGPYCNLAYEFGCYAWHYWRPAWRVLQESDAPDEVKQVIREAMLTCGDRLAFCRAWERVNGNSYAQVISALRYCSVGTGDPMQKELFDVYFTRFANGGWGERVGLGPSGPVQEGFAYAYHYASYIVETWQSVLHDLPDPRMQKAYDRIRNWFSYTANGDGLPTGPWSARTHYPLQSGTFEKEGPFKWKGFAGPDLTETVNGANEFFAARRPTYYVLTYHGRLSPKWESNAHAGQAGYGGGMLCQLYIPDKGTVLASTLNGSYGDKMNPFEWRTFHLHSLVGQMIDGSPLVAGDSEHFDAKLDGNVLASSGEVRRSTVRSSRTYTFEPAAIRCQVQLAPTQFNDLLNLWVKNPTRDHVTVAYEMIPFVPSQVPQPKQPKASPTLVKLADADGKELGELSTEALLGKTVTIDRGGFGVRIELDEPRRVLRGENNTVLVELAKSATPSDKISLSYKLVPFVTP